MKKKYKEVKEVDSLTQLKYELGITIALFLSVLIIVICMFIYMFGYEYPCSHFDNETTIEEVIYEENNQNIDWCDSCCIDWRGYIRSL